MELIFNDRNYIAYKGDISGIPYFITIFHNNKHRKGQYEVEYSMEGQTSIEDRAGKDLKHVNTLLLLIEDTLRKVVNTRLYIKSIIYRQDSLRTRYILRYITNHNIFSEYKVRSGGEFIIITIR